MYQIGEFIVKAANGVCEVKDLVHLDFSDTDSKKLYYHQQGRKVTAVDGRYFKLAENLLYGELEVALDKDTEEIHRLIQEQCG